MRPPLCGRPEHRGYGVHSHRGEPGPWLWRRDDREPRQVTTRWPR